MKIISKPYTPNKKENSSPTGKIDKHKVWLIFGILSVILVLGILAFSVYQGETLVGEASKFDPSKGQIKAAPDTLKKTPPPDPKVSLGCGDIQVFSLTGKTSTEAVAKRKQICQSAGCNYVPNTDPAKDKCTGTLKTCPPIELWDYVSQTDNTARKDFCGFAASLKCAFYDGDNSYPDNYIGDFCSSNPKPCKPNGDLDSTGTIDDKDLQALGYVVQAVKSIGNCGIPGRGTCNFPNAKIYVCKNGKAYSTPKLANVKSCEDTCQIGDLVTLSTELKPKIDDNDVFALQYVIMAQTMPNCGTSGLGTCDFPDDGIFVCKSGKAYLKSIDASFKPCN